MSILWRILGAVAAFVAVYFARAWFGTLGSVSTVAVLLLGWWLLHLYGEKRLDALYTQFERLSAEEKAQAIRELDPDIRKEMEKRDAKTNNC